MFLTLLHSEWPPIALRKAKIKDSAKEMIQEVFNPVASECNRVKDNFEIFLVFFCFFFMKTYIVGICT